jgi:hypothetical protein
MTLLKIRRFIASLGTKITSGDIEGYYKLCPEGVSGGNKGVMNHKLPTTKSGVQGFIAGWGCRCPVSPLWRGRGGTTSPPGHKLKRLNDLYPHILSLVISSTFAEVLWEADLVSFI